MPATPLKSTRLLGQPEVRCGLKSKQKNKTTTTRQIRSIKFQLEHLAYSDSKSLDVWYAVPMVGICWSAGVYVVNCHNIDIVGWFQSQPKQRSTAVVSDHNCALRFIEFKRDIPILF